MFTPIAHWASRVWLIMSAQDGPPERAGKSTILRAISGVKSRAPRGAFCSLAPAAICRMAFQ